MWRDCGTGLPVPPKRHICNYCSASFENTSRTCNACPNKACQEAEKQRVRQRAAKRQAQKRQQEKRAYMGAIAS